MQHYDIIIIGTGAGGGTILHKLKDSGKKILVLERGTFMPQEKENWDTDEVFRKERYHTKEVWKTDGDKELHPGTVIGSGETQKFMALPCSACVKKILKEYNMLMEFHWSGL